ncbi:MAG: tRNA (adenosine(37)-N6)-threonylcarbamoyltransferase complex dimerization subunit type 1 TsaB [Chloroflexi bacterium]|nr:tRNA (adenosine(37)-N6)-threonylcarbamoyltransferase complex dimerization subunit type 1 TsaB [Chloroflexota bacterium]MCY3938483.1 tRNA (adenosine(37)-N6)-threonylcarbamoyltransferase complex dimerization subunit type 1 TsaB [Chloroflexota bacterium]
MDNSRTLTLALDTSMAVSSAVLLDGAEVLAARAWRAGRKHSVHVEPNVRDVTRGKSERVGTVAVAAGPGGFSSLRTSMAFAKGLCSALGLGFAAVPTPVALAYSSPTDVESILTLIPAGSGRYFAQAFERARPSDQFLEGSSERRTLPEAKGDCFVVNAEALHEIISGPVFVAGHVSEEDLDRMRETSSWSIEFDAELIESGLARFVGLAAYHDSEPARPTNAITAIPQYMRGAGITVPARGWARA